jgi:iron complex transport system permease protein
MNPRSLRALWLGSVLLLALPLMVVVSTAYSETGAHGPLVALRSIFANVGLSEAQPQQKILELRLLRALCAIGVGGALALGGGMTQGLFRNPLAEPGLLGIGSGATLGAIIGISLLGGYGPATWLQSGGSFVSLSVVPFCAFIGALAAAITIYKLATRAGRISVPTLLLTGLAINALLGALMAGLQVLLLQDWQVSRAIIAWGFGTLDDRSALHLLVVGIGCALALLTVPFVALELDLMAGGEDDAATLGADPKVVKTLVLASVALSTAAAISVAGQIAFVGLLVPHLVRMVVGPHHRALLPVSFLAGATLLLGVVVFQHAFCPWVAESIGRASPAAARAAERIAVLQPSVLTSLMGAPFFLYLLFRQERRTLEV